VFKVFDGKARFVLGSNENRSRSELFVVPVGLALSLKQKRSSTCSGVFGCPSSSVSISIGLIPKEAQQGGLWFAGRWMISNRSRDLKCVTAAWIRVGTTRAPRRLELNEARHRPAPPTLLASERNWTDDELDGATLIPEDG